MTNRQGHWTTPEGVAHDSGDNRKREMLEQDQKQSAKRFFTSTVNWKPTELTQVQLLDLGVDPSFQTELKSLLKEEFAALNDNTEKLDPTLRGYRLERLVFKLLLLEKLNPNPSYYAKRGRALPTDAATADDAPNNDSGTKKKRGRQPGGEQVDGFFELGGRFLLVEAKWTEPIPASALYTFRGVVEGRLAGTLGLFISAGGFADDAEHALMWGKEICIILADASDIECALEVGKSFEEMIRIKLREAARIGQVYYSYRTHTDKKGA